MNLKTASVLAFERKLNTSDALMFSGKWDAIEHPNAWQGIEVIEKSVRGTISNRLKSATASDITKVDAEVQKPNLQTVDSAALPAEHDTLKVHFSLRVLGNISEPAACNNVDYQRALTKTIQSYLDKNGCKELARRYAYNLANARFLWRNRVGAEVITVSIQLNNKEVAQFDSYSHSLYDFSHTSTELTQVADAIQKGLESEDYCLLKISAYAKLGNGQEIFPSQELVQEKQNEKKGKHLYSLNKIAAMHSQKISNAIRTIDTWHPESESVGPIAIEPYGSVTNRGVAYRQPKQKQDFYSFLDSWVLKGKEPELDQQHYTIATIIRGGVFGEAG